MILLFGFKRVPEVLAVVTLVCRFCGNPAAQRIEEWTTKFTVFFVPVFTTRRRYTMQCSYCATVSELGKDEAERLAASGATTGGSGAPTAG